MVKPWVWKLFLLTLIWCHLCTTSALRGPLKRDFKYPLGAMSMSVKAMRAAYKEYPELKQLGDYSVLEKWVNAGNVAEYLSPYNIESISFPVQVHVVFVGFMGEGNLELNMDQAYLRRWFEQLPAFKEHIYSRYNEYSSSGGPMRVRFDLSYHVVQVSPDVSLLVEDIIKASLRAENPDSEESVGPQGSRLQGDPMRVVHALRSLQEYLKLSPGFSLFVLNPRPQAELYGYRWGFSDAEIEHLRHDYNFVNMAESLLTDFDEDTQSPDPPTGDTESFTGDRLRWTDHSASSQLWAEDYRKKFVSPISRPSGWDGVADMAAQWARSGNLQQRTYMRDLIRGTVMWEECLVDLWIPPSGKLAFIDLSAGPFRWGPSLEGQGVRSWMSLPVIGEMFEVYDRVSKSKTEGESWERLQSRPVDATSLENELRILQALFANNCDQKQKPASVRCSQYRKRMVRLKATLEGDTDLDEATRKVAQQLEDEMGLAGEFDAGSDAATEVVLGHIASRLSATIWESVEHVFLPSCSGAQALRRSPEGGEPTPVLFNLQRPQVQFQVHVLRSSVLDAFDLGTFKREVSKLALPGQEFSFTKHDSFVALDAPLALSAAIARRIETTSSVRRTDSHDSARVLSIDSAILRDYLLHDDELSGEVGAKRSGGGALSVPVVVFYFRNEGLPVLLDGKYQAVAMEDMVFAVATSGYEEGWESTVSCSDKPVRVDLANPTKAVIAATGQALRALLPPHAAASPVDGELHLHWLWASSSSASSCLSSALGFNDLEIESGFRHVIASGADAALAKVSSGMERLRAYQTLTNNGLALLDPVFAATSADVALKPALEEVFSALEDAKAALWMEEFESCVHAVHEAVDAADMFSSHVAKATEVLEMYTCADVGKSLSELDEGSRVGVRSMFHSAAAWIPFGGAVGFAVYTFMKRRREQYRPHIE
eukprot:Rmarinus@m.13337